KDLPTLHIEVKRAGDAGTFRPGSQIWRDACDQAERDSDGLHWIVMWRPTRSRWWSMTTMICGFRVTVAGDDDIRRVLERFRPDETEAP
ncbi:MAG: hypothetical protein AAF658_22005, partial [Myxococcota bacterium]